MYYCHLLSFLSFIILYIVSFIYSAELIGAILPGIPSAHIVFIFNCRATSKSIPPGADATSISSVFLFSSSSLFYLISKLVLYLLLYQTYLFFCLVPHILCFASICFYPSNVFPLALQYTLALNAVNLSTSIFPILPYPIINILLLYRFSAFLLLLFLLCLLP